MTGNILKQKDHGEFDIVPENQSPSQITFMKWTLSGVHELHILMLFHENQLLATYFHFTA